MDRGVPPNKCTVILVVCAVLNIEAGAYLASTPTPHALSFLHMDTDVTIYLLYVRLCMLSLAHFFLHIL